MPGSSVPHLVRWSPSRPPVRRCRSSRNDSGTVSSGKVRKYAASSACNSGLGRFTLPRAKLRTFSICRRIEWGQADGGCAACARRVSERRSSTLSGSRNDGAREGWPSVMARPGYPRRPATISSTSRAGRAGRPGNAVNGRRSSPVSRPVVPVASVRHPTTNLAKHTSFFAVRKKGRHNRDTRKNFTKDDDPHKIIYQNTPRSLLRKNNHCSTSCKQTRTPASRTCRRCSLSQQ